MRTGVVNYDERFFIGSFNKTRQKINIYLLIEFSAIEMIPQFPFVCDCRNHIHPDMMRRNRERRSNPSRRITSDIVA